MTAILSQLKDIVPNVVASFEAIIWKGLRNDDENSA